MRGDLLVDDRPPPLDPRPLAPWRQVFFDQPYNARGEEEGGMSSPCLRLSGWGQWRAVLLPALGYSHPTPTQEITPATNRKEPGPGY